MLRCDCRQCCENILHVVSVTASGGNLLFTTNSTITPKNDCRYILKIPCTIIPQTPFNAVVPVFVVVNGVNIPLQECIGNNVYSDQVRCMNKDNCGNIVLRLVYGSTPTHFKIISQKLCCSTAYGTTATAAAATVAVSATASSSTAKRSAKTEE